MAIEDTTMIQIRFKAQGANSAIGGFNSGDVARVGKALARHLVEEANVAEYVSAQAPADETQQPAAAPKKGKKRGGA